MLAGLPSGVTVTNDRRARLRRDGQVRLWWEDVPVDLFFSTVEFHTAAATRVRVVPFGDRRIPVLSATDLAVCKCLFGRPKDWLDIAAMRDAGTIDPVEALTWVERMAGADSEGYRRLDAILRAAPSPSSDRDELPPSLQRRRDRQGR